MPCDSRCSAGLPETGGVNPVLSPGRNFSLARDRCYESWIATETPGSIGSPGRDVSGDRIGLSL